MKNSIKLVVILALLSPSCQKTILGTDEAKPPLPTQHSSSLATILDYLRYALDLPALAGAIMTDTGIVDAQAVGCRRYGGTANVTNNDQFHLGSCGKSFTAVLLGILVDKGKIKWTSTLPEIFPEYANMMRQEYRDVNLLDILSHSAGFMRDPDMKPHSISPRDQRIEIVSWALTQPPAAQRGHELYSNLGFIIAGAIAEKVADSSYEDLLMEKVIRPLGLATAGFGVMGTAGLEDEPLQHTPNHSPIIATPDARLEATYNPAGGLYMSVGDWAKYCQWVLACESGHPTLLSAQSARTITTPYAALDANGGGSALGWGVGYRSWAGGNALMHTGSNGYNYAEVGLAPARHFGVIVMTNQGAGTTNDPIGTVVARLINFYQNGR